MKLNYSFLLLCLFFCSSEVLGSNLFNDSRSLGLSSSNVAMNTTYNSNPNVASFVNSEFNGFLVNHQINYFVKELSVSLIQFNYHINKYSCIQSAFSYSGNKNFNETNFQIGYGKKLGEKLNAGITFNYSRLNYSDNSYSTIPIATPTIYIFAKATNKIHFGCSIHNPARIKIKSKQNYPASLIGGVSYLPTDKTKLAIVAIQENGKEMKFSVGLEYMFMNTLELRAGYQNKINLLSAGLSLILKNLQIEFAYRSQLIIGNSTSLSILIPVK